MANEPFDIDVAIKRRRDAVKPFPKAAMFEFRDDEVASPFEQLLASCSPSARGKRSASSPPAVPARSRAGRADQRRDVPRTQGSARPGARDEPAISADIHVHRVTNGWGYVRAITREATMAELGEVLPERYRVEINERLVPFCKHICTGTRHTCSTWPIVDMCA
jgi:endonuclease III